LNRPHLRHAFAVRLYETTRDVYPVEKALGYANVSVTEGLSAVDRCGGLRPVGRGAPGITSPPPVSTCYRQLYLVQDEVRSD